MLEPVHEFKCKMFCHHYRVYLLWFLFVLNSLRLSDQSTTMESMHIKVGPSPLAYLYGGYSLSSKGNNHFLPWLEKGRAIPNLINMLLYVCSECYFQAETLRGRDCVHPLSNPIPCSTSNWSLVRLWWTRTDEITYLIISLGNTRAIQCTEYDQQGTRANCDLSFTKVIEIKLLYLVGKFAWCYIWLSMLSYPIKPLVWKICPKPWSKSVLAKSGTYRVQDFITICTYHRWVVLQCTGDWSQCWTDNLVSQQRWKFADGLKGVDLWKDV